MLALVPTSTCLSPSKMIGLSKCAIIALISICANTNAMPQSDNPDAWLAVINGNSNNNNEVAQDQRAPEEPPQDPRQQYQTPENINRRVDQQQYPVQENRLSGPPPPYRGAVPPPQPQGAYRGGAPANARLGVNGAPPPPRPLPQQRRPLQPQQPLPQQRRPAPAKQQGGILDTVVSGVQNVANGVANGVSCAATNLITDDKLSDDDFIRFQMDCASNRGPCDDIGRQIKILAPEVLAGRCPAPCNPCIKKQIRKVMSQLSQKYPRRFQEMMADLRRG